MIAVAELNQTIPFQQYDEDETPPKRIGFCSNPTSRLEICGRSIFDDDIEAVELPQIGKRRVFCCGPCLEKLLFPHLFGHDPEKNSKKQKGGDHWKSSRTPREPQVHKGEDLK